MIILQIIFSLFKLRFQNLFCISCSVCILSTDTGLGNQRATRAYENTFNTTWIVG